MLEGGEVQAQIGVHLRDISECQREGRWFDEEAELYWNNSQQ